MKALVCHLGKCDDRSDFSVRIAARLCSVLDLPLMDGENAEVLKHDWDVVFLVNSPRTHCSRAMREQVAELMVKARFPIFCQQGHTDKLPAACKRVFNNLHNPSEDESVAFVPAIWGMVSGKFLKVNVADAHIDWNMVSWPGQQPKEAAMHKGLFYWGSWKDREEDYAAYLNTSLYPVTISTNYTDAVKFQTVAPNAKVISAARHLFPVLTQAEATLYIEDVRSHSNYTSLASRFYEALATHTAILIDDKCRSTFDDAGIKKIDNFVVRSDRDVARVIKDSHEIATKQFSLWRRDYTRALNRQIEQAWSAVMRIAAAPKETPKPISDGPSTPSRPDEAMP